MPHWAKEPKDRKKLDKPDYVMGSKTKLPPPTLSDEGVYFDNTVAVLSRLYDRDRDRVIRRAVMEGVAGMLCWNPDIDKLEELNKLCTANESLCYFMAGVHPDNISRTNKSQQEAWHLKVDEYSRERSCRAIFSGLNITRRDAHSHFAQESMLRCLYQQAKTLSLPLMLMIESREGEAKAGFLGEMTPRNSNVSRVTAILAEEGWGGHAAGSIPVVVLDAIGTCRGDTSIMGDIIAAGFHVAISLNELFLQETGAATERGDAALNARVLACTTVIPRQRLLISSNSPHQTPQNIPDEIIRQSKNEPSNFKYMVDVLSSYFNCTAEELATLNLENSKRIYGIDGSLVAAVERDKLDIEARKPRSESECIREMEKLSVAGGGASADEDMSNCYACSKCAGVLFPSQLLTSRHPINVAPSEGVETVFRASEGEVTFCDAVYFVPSSVLDRHGDKLSLDSKQNVSCAHCSAKIGKQQGGSGDAETSTTCPCGFAVDCRGGVLRLNSTKVQVHNAAVSKTKSKKIVLEEQQDADVSRGGRKARGGGTDKTKETDQKQAKPNKKGKSTRKNH